MDTDSFLHSRKPKTGLLVGDLKDLEKTKNFYDFCKFKNYPALFSEENEIVLGKLENESPGTLVTDENCALSAKRYAYKTKIKEEKTYRIYQSNTLYGWI